MTAAGARSPGFLGGPRALRDALGLLFARSELWPLCAAPVALNLLAFGLAVAFFFANLDTLTAALEVWLVLPDPEAWYQWIWVGPVRALAWLLRGILLLVFAATVYVLFTLVGGVLASPFLDRIAARVEHIQTGGVVDAARGGLRGTALSAGRAIVAQAKRTAFFVSVEVGLLVLGLVPGLQPLAALGIPLFAALFIPLDYTGYLLDRREIPFRRRRAWVWLHRRAMLGFGGAALASFAIPGLNFLCLPWLVTAGTLLALEVGPPQADSD